MRQIRHHDPVGRGILNITSRKVGSIDLPIVLHQSTALAGESIRCDDRMLGRDLGSEIGMIDALDDVREFLGATIDHRNEFTVLEIITIKHENYDPEALVHGILGRFTIPGVTTPYAGLELNATEAVGRRSDLDDGE